MDAESHARGIGRALAFVVFTGFAGGDARSCRRLRF